MFAHVPILFLYFFEWETGLHYYDTDDQKKKQYRLL